MKKMTNHKFNFVDLFAGIGGFRIALEKLGGKCIGFSEIEKNAISVYKQNFKSNPNEIEFGSVENLNKIPIDEIDLIVGGVPCQSWSVAGKMKGFEDPRGKLWFDTIRVIKLNKPKSFILENVKGLADPRNIENLNLILNELKSIGYEVSHKVLNSYDFGLPQNRDRIFIVGFSKNIQKDKHFEFPKPVNKEPLLYQFLNFDSTKDFRKEKIKIDSSEIFGNKVPFGRNRFQSDDTLNDFFVFCDTRDGHSTIHSWDIITTTKHEKQICLTLLKNRRKKIYGSQDGNPLSLKNFNELLNNVTQKDLQSLVKKNILREIKGRGYDFVNSKNSSGINGIYRIYLPNSKVFSTLTATGTKDMISTIEIESDNVSDYKNKFLNEVYKKGNYREITSRESANLQGFPVDYLLHKDEKNAFILEVEKEYPVYIGKEFWHRFTGDENFYTDLIQTIVSIANDVDMKSFLDEIVDKLSFKLKEKYKID
jgi:DNA (cytosine-5)-methyltransferase 1